MERVLIVGGGILFLLGHALKAYKEFCNPKFTPGRTPLRELTPEELEERKKEFVKKIEKWKENKENSLKWSEAKQESTRSPI